MELTDAIARRRMVRAFTDQPVSRAVLDQLCDHARRAPSAGNTQAMEFLVLDTPEAVARYWDATLAPSRRVGFRWPGLIAAPAVILAMVRPDAYIERYREPDKATTGLGEGPQAWPVPYWWVDAGAALEHLLLGAVDRGLGACLFGPFEHEPAVAKAFGIPGDRRIVAAVAMGIAAVDEPGRSARRPRRPLADVVRYGRWN